MEARLQVVTALSWYGKKAMLDYWNDLTNDLHIPANLFLLRDVRFLSWKCQDF